MEARKLAVQVAAVCPFALVLGMGMTFRHPTSSHATLQYTDAQNERIEAYSPLNLRVLPVKSTAKVANREADVWITLSDREKLQALTPSFQEDEDGDSPREQVIQTWSALIQRLAAITRRDVREHQNSAAIREVARTLRFGEILKYSDFDTLRQANSISAKSLELVSPFVKFASKSDRSDLRLALAEVNRNRGRLPKMYKILRSNFDDFVFREMGNGHQIGDDSPKTNEPTCLDDPQVGENAEQLQHLYVTAIKCESDLRKATNKLFAGSSSAKS